MWQAAAWCTLISLVYVFSLYMWRTPANRQHPTTVKFRILSVLLASAVAWIPSRLKYRDWQIKLADDGNTHYVPSYVELLGIQTDRKQLTAAAQPLAMVVVLFVGPLWYEALKWLRQQKSTEGYQLSNRLLIHKIRDCLVAPVTEEWCFRACMVPLLWLQGTKLSSIILLTPLFFGVGHAHHVYFLARQGISVKEALHGVCFQVLYTTVFGWFATWVFCWTGRLAPVVAVHAFCNVMGVPAFGDMAANASGQVIMAVTAAGVLGFGSMLWFLASAPEERYSYAPFPILASSG